MIPLKEAVSTKHQEAEQHVVNRHLMSGHVMEHEYYMYLVQQLNIFEAIERFPLPHPSLNRMDAVLEDMNELPRQSMHGWVPNILTNSVITNSTYEYIDYLETLTQEELLPHVYLNYLALVFGGQIMKDKVLGSGKMYEFDNMKDIIMSIRSIQKDEWADEVNKGFTYIIGIFNELQTIFGLPS
jgi:heme oxygenase